METVFFCLKKLFEINGVFMRPLIIDAFIYNGDNLLEYRLDTLNNYVDHFIITESAETFTKIKKPLIYINENKSIFEKYKHKISLLLIPEFPTPDISWLAHKKPPLDKILNWWHEAYQREFCRPEILRVSDGRPFILIFSDLDEIPNPGILVQRDDLYSMMTSPLYLEMSFHYYNFKWESDDKWTRSFLVNDKLLSDLYLDDLRSQSVHPGSIHLSNGGWHLSYFEPIDKIVEKMESSSHTEFNVEDFKSYDHISQCIKTGFDLYGRTAAFRPTKSTTKFPGNWTDMESKLSLQQK
jgi:beta-1,4-mannosyl-glycoprotein beta-1,4-N-acetylglucosaminyltransferase